MRPLGKDTIEVLQQLNTLLNRAWVRPLDIGGHNNSHHASSLRTLERKGFVESKQRMPHMSRGSKLWAITPLGRRFCREIQTTLPLS